MIPKIRKVIPEEDFFLFVEFDDGQKVVYDVKNDIKSISDFRSLKSEKGLFQNVQIDSSRTCVFWTDRIDLPSDIILEYGKPA
ncbi:MAG: DUF2442 domain-containing protein [Bacteroidales bacterium]|nr:DUF2442 domain-containing protein [Bacteroidales bacterium]